jgi:hypothetical protein
MKPLKYTLYTQQALHEAQQYYHNIYYAMFRDVNSQSLQCQHVLLLS